MAEQTILQHPLFMKFILPFALIFFVIFGILEKTKVLGENRQLNALVAFVIGLIFTGFAYPKLVVTNMILFLTVAVIIMFVGLMLWGFVSQGEVKLDREWIKWGFGLGIFGVVGIAVIWATGGTSSFIYKFLFSSDVFGNAMIINVIFVVAIAAVLATVLREGK